jgi:CTP synthase
VARLDGAHSTEFAAKTPYPVIALITEWLNADGTVEHRGNDVDLGGSMRLGAQQCKLAKGTIARSLYGQDVISERHRHRYEFNNRYRQDLEDAGLKVAGTSIDGRLVEMIENPAHPWFVACQFHPEFTSTPRYGHPLFKGFIEAAIAQREKSVREAASA